MKAFMFAFLPIISSPLVLISCAAQQNQPTFFQIQAYLNDKQNLPSFALPQVVKPLAGIKTIINDDQSRFQSVLKSYLKIDHQFQTFLDQNNLWQTIKQVVISPQPNQRFVKVILLSDNDDLASASVIVDNYFPTPFIYQPEQTIVIDHIISEINYFPDPLDFQTQFSNLINNQDLSILNRAFKIHPDQLSKIAANFDKFSFIATADFQIKWMLKIDAIDQGFVFNYHDQYQSSIICQPLIYQPI